MSGRRVWWFTGLVLTIGLGARAENRYRDSNGKIRVAPIKMRVASVGTATQ
jgi:hypothetical protein